MKVNDLEESELRMYAYLHKLLSKSEMNDICMWLYDTRWSVQNKSFTIWQIYSIYDASDIFCCVQPFFCFVLTGIICYAWQCLPFQAKYVANSYKGKVFTKHHRGWEKHIAFRLKEVIKKSFFTFARFSVRVFWLRNQDRDYRKLERTD